MNGLLYVLIFALLFFAELFYFVYNNTYYDDKFLSIFNILFLELSVIFLFML